MDLLERYLKQIERYLPFKERLETTKELRSLILDQVDEAVSSGIDKETALYDIIVKMGDPRTVASNYVDTKPIISKEMEPILQLVLKIVSITLPLAIIFASLLDYVFSNTQASLMDILLQIVYTIPEALYSLLVGYGFVFIFFYLIERYIQPKFEAIDKEFHPNLLPKIPTKDFKVSLFESIVTTLVTIGVVYLFNMQQGLIAVYYDDIREPLFNANFDKILPFMNIGWFISIGLNIYYIFSRSKNITTKTIEFAHNIYSAVILFLLATSNIFNSIIVDGYDLTIVPTIIKVVFIGLGIAIIIGAIVEYVKMYINLDALDELDQTKSPKQ